MNSSVQYNGRTKLLTIKDNTPGDLFTLFKGQYVHIRHIRFQIFLLSAPAMSMTSLAASVDLYLNSEREIKFAERVFCLV